MREKVCGDGCVMPEPKAIATAQLIANEIIFLCGLPENNRNEMWTMAKKKTVKKTTTKKSAAKLTTSDIPDYHLQIVLEESDPEIWREIVVPGNLTLENVHYAVQAAMGWQNSHMHQFEFDDRNFTELTDDGFTDDDIEDEQKVTLHDLFADSKKLLRYWYDFGDDWWHQIKVLKKIPATEKVETFVCVAGEKRCPMEDTGGLWGYYDKLEALKDPKHPEHEDMLEWMGKEFDPDFFDIKFVNKELARFKKFLKAK